MSDNDTNTTLLIQYLDGELDRDTLTEVENRISNDPSLLQELENLRNTQTAVKSYGLRLQVSDIHKSMMQEFAATETKKAPVVSMVRKVFRVAAIFIVVLGFLSVYQYSTLSSATLFESNFQPFNVGEVRGQTNPSSLEQLYKQHRTQQVINNFSQLKEPSVSDYFYAANTYLDKHEPEKAIHFFTLLQQKNMQMNSHLLEDDYEYYLAMAYLQNNEPAKALPILDRIHNDEQHLYHDKVGSLFVFKVKLLSKK